MVAFARNTDVPASVHLGNRVAARTRNGVFRNGKYESRLVRTESLPSVPDAAKVRVENVYDYLGRRIRKVASSDFSGGDYSTTNVTTFVYDGWLAVAETTDQGGSISTNLNVWGLDLSGSPQGAGGVGGLLAAIQDGEGYVACVDGNGNVTDYVDASGAIVAHREYSPFGQTIVAVGAKKGDFAHWFSTKPLDSETGLYAYTFRYYDPERGRWLCVDPISERGGLNLYSAFLENPISHIDPLGMASFNVGLGFAGSGTLFVPMSPNLIGGGMSVTYSTFLAIAVDTSRPQEVLQCAVCHSGSVTFMGGVGAAVNFSAGPMVTFGPSGDLNDLSGVSVHVGGGVGVPINPGTVGPSVEYTIDVDIPSRQVTVVVPKIGVGATAYAAVRISGSCTGCTGIFGSATVRNTKLSTCLRNVAAAVNGALKELAENGASSTHETRLVFTHPGEISPDSLE